ncbi:uncharacterized protein LOC133371502 [Rhineura floridana]|uniref:uncharacterized protein LOC133371502 n=1 Tax=Rhineura floridana TaxID=261503 RepID=UPI002AC7F72B|nr:uncharacterized protein LOC133371502 [Rhineura floridana]
MRQEASEGAELNPPPEPKAAASGLAKPVCPPHVPLPPAPVVDGTLQPFLTGLFGSAACCQSRLCPAAKRPWSKARPSTVKRAKRVGGQLQHAARGLPPAARSSDDGAALQRCIGGFGHRERRLSSGISLRASRSQGHVAEAAALTALARPLPPLPGLPLIAIRAAVTFTAVAAPIQLVRRFRQKPRRPLPFRPGRQASSHFADGALRQALAQGAAGSLRQLQPHPSFHGGFKRSQRAPQCFVRGGGRGGRAGGLETEGGPFLQQKPWPARLRTASAIGFCAPDAPDCLIGGASQDGTRPPSPESAAGVNVSSREPGRDAGRGGGEEGGTPPHPRPANGTRDCPMGAGVGVALPPAAFKRGPLPLPRQQRKLSPVMRFSASAPSGLVLLPLLLLSRLCLCAAIQWLGMAANGTRVAWDAPQHCRLLEGLAPDPFVRLCRRNLEVMPSIVQAAERTKGVCRKTFADMRWNCSSVQDAPHLAPDLRKGSKESAFVYALASAAISHSIAQACASGQVPFCSCGSAPTEEPQPDFQWGGCGDNLRFGLQLGSAFVDGPMKSSKAGTRVSRLVNLHNNAVGRQESKSATKLVTSLHWMGEEASAPFLFPTHFPHQSAREPQFGAGCEVLMDSLETKCQCHGVSGSCAVKTCWKSLRDLADIGLELKSKYLAATQVMPWFTGLRKQLVPRGPSVRLLKEDELVYLVHSSNYCMKNPRLGSLGTQDRHCNKTSAGSDSCNLLCCGRGYNTYSESVEEKCQCKYYWCCYVKCKKCQNVVERFVCK